jgi:hypothetical protein
MKNDYTQIKVIAHIMLTNMWEYYVCECDSKGNAFGLVCGFETELGYFSINEIKPHMISMTSDLSDIMPAPDWEWA